MGPDSFNLPSDLDLNNNDGGSTIGDHGEEEGGSSKAKKKKYKNENVVLFDEFGRYIIEDYDANPPFSDILPVSSQQLVVVPNYSAILLCWFHHNSYSYILLSLSTLPLHTSHQGVAGIYGKPLYVFYVNRGQGIASFGVKSKDYPIMEYYTANNAYQNTALLGFRTFYKGRRNGNLLQGNKKREFLVEPFDSSRTRFSQLMDSSGSDLNEQEESSKYPKRRMFIGANDMTIQEVDMLNKIETNVTYFNLPEEDFGAFVKRTTISNLDEKDALHLSVLDGLARIQPVGGKLEAQLKMIGRTLE